MILSFCPNPSIDCFAWLENFTPSEVNRIENLEKYPGGKGVHIALAISELGGISYLMGNWAGSTGEWIKEWCRNKNITISGVALEGDNRRCYTFRSSRGGVNNTELLEPGPEMSRQNWLDLVDSFEKESSDANIICLSGSWPKKAPKDAYAQLIKIAKRRDKKIILDCQGGQLREALKTSFFGLHLNEHEAYEAFGSKNLSFIVKKIGGAVELVALSRGERGLAMAYKGKIYNANVKIDKIESTVGSGDALTAGIAWAVEQKLDPEEIASYAVACGAANCINAELGMIRKEDVKKLLLNVKYNIEEI